MVPQLNQSPNESSQPQSPKSDPILEEAEETLRMLSDPELELQMFGPEEYDRRSRMLLASLDRKPEKPSPRLEAAGMERVYLDGPIPMWAIRMKKGPPSTLTTRPYHPSMDLPQSK